MKRLFAILLRPRLSLALLFCILGACAGAVSRVSAPEPSWNDALRVSAFEECFQATRNDQRFCQCLVQALQIVSPNPETLSLQEVRLAASLCRDFA